MTPQHILVMPETLRLIEKIIQKEFQDSTLADSCYIFILEKLREDDHKRLRAFAGRSSINTFLYVVISSLAIDFKRTINGRFRVPKRISQMGSAVVKSYRLRHLHGCSLREIHAILTGEDGYTKSYSDFLTEMECVLISPRAVGAHTMQFVSLNGDQMLAETIPDPDSTNPLDTLIELLDDACRTKALAVIREAVAEFSSEDQALIRLVYGSDCKISTVARMLCLPENVARRRLKALLEALREQLLARGIRES